MPAMPSSESETIVHPATAPPRRETCSASITEFLAAAAVRMFARTEIIMPTIPAIAENTAPAKNAIPVLAAVPHAPVKP